MLKFGLNQAQVEILENIFKQYYSVEKVLIFGSRAMGSFKPFSDIDLCLYGKINDTTLAKINNDIIESNLIYTVDLVVFEDITNLKFRQNIQKAGKVFWSRGGS
jgi:uncharacterized protein